MDYLEQLAKVFRAITYHGCRIEYFKNEFWVFGKPYPTLDEAKKIVDESKGYLGKSIKK